MNYINFNNPTELEAFLHNRLKTNKQDMSLRAVIDDIDEIACEQELELDNDFCHNFNDIYNQMVDEFLVNHGIYDLYSEVSELVSKKSGDKYHEKMYYIVDFALNNSGQTVFEELLTLKNELE